MAAYFLRGLPNLSPTAGVQRIHRSCFSFASLSPLSDKTTALPRNFSCRFYGSPVLPSAPFATFSVARAFSSGQARPPIPPCHTFDRVSTLHLVRGDRVPATRHPSPLEALHDHRNLDKVLTAGSVSGDAALSRFFSTHETLTDKCYRWLDVTGVLTRWNNRKEWVLDLIPSNRIGSATVTEFERKQEMFVTLNAQLLALIAMYLAWTGIQHVNVKPANPSYEGFPGVDGRKKDFTLMNRMFFIEPKERCKECRWLDLECKKECFSRLKAEGHHFFVNGGDPLSIPRTKLEPPHFH